MNKAMFKDFMKSVQEGGAILRGQLKPKRTFKIKEPNAGRIRKSLNLSQEQFAALLGISVATLRNWEQGRRKPEGSARILLGVAEKHPEVLPDVVGW